MRSLTAAIIVVLGLAATRATVAENHRAPPAATRAAVLGCWDTNAGTTLRLERLGKHGVRYRARFTTRPRGGPREMTGRAIWSADHAELELACRPRSQHGSFCRIAPTKAGLSVRVYAKRYDNPHGGHLVEHFVARRCTAVAWQLVTRGRSGRSRSSSRAGCRASARCTAGRGPRRGTA